MYGEREKGQKDKVATQSRMYKCVFVGFDLQTFSALKELSMENVNLLYLFRNISIFEDYSLYNILFVPLDRSYI